MAKTPELLFDDVPAPGEPLKAKVHPVNAALLQQELAERAERAKAELPFLVRWRLKRRYRALHNLLRRHGYNALLIDLHETYNRYQQVAAALRTKPANARALLTEYQQLKRHGAALKARLIKLKPFADEFELTSQRLRAHAAYRQWQRRDKQDKREFRREAAVWEAQIKSVFRQSPRLHHAGTNKHGKAFIKIPRFEKILFKEDRVLYQIRTSHQSIVKRLMGRWESALPYGVDIHDLKSEETLENLSAACKRVVQVEYSNSGANMFYVISRLDAPDGLPRKVPYNKIIPYYPRELHSETPWAAGITRDKKVKWYTFEKVPHILIAGSTQGGKSNHINQMIALMVTMNSPEELKLILVDMKGGIEFTHWSGLAHQLMPMIKRPEQVLDGLRQLRGIMEERLAAFEAVKAKNLSSYNTKSREKLPRVVMFVDEMATLIGLDITNDIHTELRVLSSQGRAVGIHLVLCTQHPTIDTIPGWIKTNMGVRIAAKMPSSSASQIILDTNTAALLPPLPGRMVFSIGREELIAQSPFISDDEIAIAVRNSQAFSSAAPAPEAAPAKPARKKVTFGREQVIEIALTRFEGKLSEAEIHQAVGVNSVTLRQVRSAIKSIVEDAKEGLEYGDSVLSIKRKGRAYFLIQQPAQQGDDEDTQEIEPLDNWNVGTEAGAA